MKWYYRFGNEDPMVGLMFTGSINVSDDASEAQARKAVCAKHNIKRLPAQTFMISAELYEGLHHVNQ